MNSEYLGFGMTIPWHVVGYSLGSNGINEAIKDKGGKFLKEEKWLK